MSRSVTPFPGLGTGFDAFSHVITSKTTPPAKDLIDAWDELYSAGFYYFASQMYSKNKVQILSPAWWVYRLFNSLSFLRSASTSERKQAARAELNNTLSKSIGDKWEPVRIELLKFSALVSDELSSRRAALAKLRDATATQVPKRKLPKIPMIYKQAVKLWLAFKAQTEKGTRADFKGLRQWLMKRPNPIQLPATFEKWWASYSRQLRRCQSR